MLEWNKKNKEIWGFFSGNTYVRKYSVRKSQVMKQEIINRANKKKCICIIFVWTLKHLCQSFATLILCYCYWNKTRKGKSEYERSHLLFGFLQIKPFWEEQGRTLQQPVAADSSTQKLSSSPEGCPSAQLTKSKALLSCQSSCPDVANVSINTNRSTGKVFTLVHIDIILLSSAYKAILPSEIPSVVFDAFYVIWFLSKNNLIAFPNYDLQIYQS